MEKEVLIDRDVLIRFQRWTIYLTPEQAGKFWDDIEWLCSKNATPQALSGCAVRAEIQRSGNKRREGRSALRMKDGKLETFDPHYVSKRNEVVSRLDNLTRCGGEQQLTSTQALRQAFDAGAKYEAMPEG